VTQNKNKSKNLFKYDITQIFGLNNEVFNTYGKTKNGIILEILEDVLFLEELKGDKNVIYIGCITKT
jgi:hypothetical protein